MKFQTARGGRKAVGINFLTAFLIAFIGYISYNNTTKTQVPIVFEA